MSLIQRHRLVAEIRSGLKHSPVVALLGTRQVGKSTLARLACAGRKPVHYFDLELELDRRRLSLAPQTVLEALRGTVVIDEIQRMPRLFELLRPLTDRRPLPAHFLVLGSASPDLVRGVSETLAGRIQFVSVPGLSLQEVGADRQTDLWLRGGLPPAFLAENDELSLRWRRDFITTFVERDIPQLGLRIPSEAIRRFWLMLGGYHGCIWNACEMARSLGTADKTARHYLDILSGTFTARVLPPWYENIPKRQIKSPKIYIRDSGLLHALLDIQTLAQLQSNRIYGASWEGFALEQTLTSHGADNAFFWNAQGVCELDLLLIRGGRRYGFEFKCTDAPTMTQSLHKAMDELELAHAWVVYPGKSAYPMHERAGALPLEDISSLVLR